MKICLITSSFLPLVGGAEVGVHNLATALRSLNHHVVVMAPRFSAPFRSRVSYELRTFPMGTLTLLKQSPRLGDLYSLGTIAHLRRQRFDVVNVHFALPWGPVLIRHKKLLASPVILTFRGADVQKEDSVGYGFRRDGRLEKQLRVVVAGADGVVVLSNSMRQATVELTAFPRQISVIPNGIHWKRFAEAGPSGRFRRRFDIPDDAPLLLAVGRHHPKKAFPILVQAIRKVVDAEPRTRCVIIGRGVSALTGLVDSLGLALNVILAEQIGPDGSTERSLTVPSDALLEAYKDSTVFVSASLVEGWPNVVAEALAAGIPAVVTDTPGNRDVVEDARTGLLCRPQDPEDLAAKILALLRSPPYRAMLSANAVAASKRRDWRGIAARYVAVYESVLYERSRRWLPANSRNALDTLRKPLSRS